MLTRRIRSLYALFLAFSILSLAQHLPATASGWIPERNFAEVKGVPRWTDLNPRAGASYDLFGSSRTALKASIGRYVGQMNTNVQLANNPITTSVNSVTRQWRDLNGNYIPDCDLANFNDQPECGPISNQNFGKNNPLATRMIAIFDEDGSGAVDFQEFIAGLSAFSSKGNKEEKLRCTAQTRLSGR